VNQRQPQKKSIQVPAFAWPTFSLFVACVAIWGFAIWAVATDTITHGWGFILATLAIYASFTPMHDAVHQSVSKLRWVNALVGRVCGWMLLGSYVAFRHTHLEHHKHTNQPDKDPDYWSGKGPFWLLPFRWASQDLHYWYLYARSWRQHPIQDRLETIAVVIIQMIGLALLIVSNHFWLAFFLWFLPAKCAISFLAFSFDYLPHKPHLITAKEDRYKATLVRPNPILTLLFLQQNYHLIHHLYPAIPFYRYGSIWRAQREDLIEKGADVRYMLPTKTVET
jgi:beta-carotene hydroxylase